MLNDVPASTPAPVTGGDLVVQSLVEHGVDTVFGLPGIQLDHLFCALHDAPAPPRIIIARHEQGAAYMAFGYAQATGKVGAYAVVPGPGFLNTTAALSTAYACNAPVLAIIGQVDSAAIGRHEAELHQLKDQTAIVAALTRAHWLPVTAADISVDLAAAFAMLEQERRGPVAIEIPPDLLAARIQTLPAVTPRAPAPVPTLDSRVVRGMLAALAGARRPIMFVGGGAVHAYKEVRALAERLGLPVVSNRQGRGIVSDHDPRALGLYDAASIWNEVDVVLAVGTRLSHPRKSWGFGPGQTLLQIDHDTDILAREPRPQLSLCVDAGLALRALLTELETFDGRVQRRDSGLHDVRRRTLETFETQLGPQMSYLRSLRAVLPENGIVVADYTQIGYVATAAFPVFAPRSLITPGYQGTLGFGFATALGAKVGCPDRAVLSINGDGGFLFTANELASAVQHRIGVVSIVFSDAMFGNVRRMQEINYGGRVIGTDLTNPDFVRFAESFGAVGVRAHDPQSLGLAVRQALGNDLPTVIEVPVERFPDPWPLLFPALPAKVEAKAPTRR